MQLSNRTTLSQNSRHVQMIEPGNTGDPLDVTDREAVLLTQALRTAQNVPDIRAEKVAALKASVEAGAYPIDSARIAQALIREEPGLFTF